MVASVVVLTAIASVSGVYAALGKATLFPNGLHDPLSAMDNSYNPPHSYFYVAPPQICVQHANDNHCDIPSLQAVQVSYGDCSQPWTLCRCSNANMNIDDVVYRFGQIPVGIRSYVGSALATNAASCSAGSGGDFIVFNGDCAESVFNHEAGHSLDKGVSQSSTWSNAIAQSSCVPDAYANSSPAEDFAQVNVLYTYQSHFGPIPKDPACLQPQLNVFYNDARLAATQGTTTCFPDKRPFSLSKSTSAKLGALVATETVPYVPIKPTATIAAASKNSTTA